MGVAYGDLVQAHLKLIIFLPQSVDIDHWDADRALIGLPELVHLLLILPGGSSDLSWCGLDKLNILLPDSSGFSIHSDVGQNEVVCLGNGGPSGSGNIVGKVVAAPDIVKIDGPEVDIWNGE